MKEKPFLFGKYLILKLMNQLMSGCVDICMNWIPVLQTKPKEMREVLIYDDVLGMVIGYYFEPRHCFIGSVDGVKLTHAVYWMQLPEIPVLIQR